MSELVSIVMGVYNGTKYLREQIESILEQTYSNFELIVVDDASTDNSVELLKVYAESDSRIRLLPSEANSGVVATFEKGLKQASGEYIAFADQDDVFRADKIELLLKKLKSNPERDLVISDLCLIDESGKQFHPSLWEYQSLSPEAGKPFAKLIFRNFATGCTMMFRRRLLDLALPFPANCHMHDWWLAVVAASSEAGGICLINEPLVYYRQHGSNVLGAEHVRKLNFASTIDRLKNPPAPEETQEKKLRSAKLHVPRLTGYLQKNIWTDGERKTIQEVISVVEGYVLDADEGLLQRIKRLPLRLKYAATNDQLVYLLYAIFQTLWPSR